MKTEAPWCKKSGLESSILVSVNKIQDTFMKAHDRHADSMFRYCYTRVSNRDDALDLTQDAFTRTWDYLYKGKTIRNLKAFMFMTLNNLIIDWYRKKKPIPLDYDVALQIPDTEHSKDPFLEAEGKWALSLLDKLQEKQKTVVTLRYVEGFSPKEIAKLLGEEENTVSVRIHRAIASLQELVQKQNYE